jgi:hypothetical protein
VFTPTPWKHRVDGWLQSGSAAGGEMPDSSLNANAPETTSRSSASLQLGMDQLGLAPRKSYPSGSSGMSASPNSSPRLGSSRLSSKTSESEGGEENLEAQRFFQDWLSGTYTSQEEQLAQLAQASPHDVIEALKKVPLSNFENRCFRGFNKLIPLLAESTDTGKVCEIMRLLPGLAFEKMAELPGKEGWIFLRNLLNAVDEELSVNQVTQEYQLAFCLALPLNIYDLFLKAANKLDVIDYKISAEAINIDLIIFNLKNIINNK